MPIPKGARKTSRNKKNKLKQTKKSKKKTSKSGKSKTPAPANDKQKPLNLKAPNLIASPKKRSKLRSPHRPESVPMVNPVNQVGAPIPEKKVRAKKSKSKNAGKKRSKNRRSRKQKGMPMESPVNPAVVNPVNQVAGPNPENKLHGKKTRGRARKIDPNANFVNTQQPAVRLATHEVPPPRILTSQVAAPKPTKVSKPKKKHRAKSRGHSKHGEKKKKSRKSSHKLPTSSKNSSRRKHSSKHKDPKPNEHSKDELPQLKLNLKVLLRIGSVLEKTGCDVERRKAFEWLYTNRKDLQQDTYNTSKKIMLAIGDLPMSKELAYEVVQILLKKRAITEKEYAENFMVIERAPSDQNMTVAQLVHLLNVGTSYYHKQH